MSMAIWRKAALAALALAAMNATLAAEQALPPTADRGRRVEIPLIIGKLENGVSEAGVIRLPFDKVRDNGRWPVSPTVLDSAQMAFHGMATTCSATRYGS